MTQEKRLHDLLFFLLQERVEYKQISIPKTLEEQRYLLRSLINVRPPAPISKEFLDIQDAYLQTELASKGITIKKI